MSVSNANNEQTTIWSQWEEAAPSNPKVQEQLEWAKRAPNFFTASLIACALLLLISIPSGIVCGSATSITSPAFITGMTLIDSSIIVTIVLILLSSIASKHRNQILADKTGSLLESLKEREPVHVNPTLVVNPN